MKSKILILFTLLTVLIFSCEKREITHFKLTDVNIKMIPYVLGQTIIFIDSLRQPFVMTVTTDSLWCFQEETERVDLRTVRLKSKHGNLSFKMSVGGGTEKMSYNELSININPFIFWLRYKNKDGQFVTDTANNEYKQYFHDSLKINSKIYSGVVEYIKTEPAYPDENKEKERLPMRLLYNKTEGILQLEDKDKVLFMIDN